MKEFSFIVPTYNEERYIDKCLASIANQNYDRSKYEVIVSDSSSTDKTANIARPRVDQFVTTDKRGIAHGRNLGAQHAFGKFLVFVDADVILEKEFLAEIQRSFTNEQVVAVTGVPSPMDGKLLQRWTYHGTYFIVRAFNAARLPFYPGICVAYRRNVFEKCGGFREDFGIVEDLDLTKRVSKHGKCVVNPKAKALVSTRRLDRFAFSTAVFHIYNHLRYLLTGTAAKYYPKQEEIHSPLDLWRINR